MINLGRVPQDKRVYFLAIDSGGTKTDVVIGDAGSVLARESGPSIKITNVSREIAQQNLESLVYAALSRAGLTGAQIDHTCVGMSGFSLHSARDWMNGAVTALLNKPPRIVGDEEIAHYAAFNGNSGVLVIAGTGSIAIGKSPEGHKGRCGGWGPRFSDEGSATWIGELAVRKALRSRDRGAGAPLLSRIMEERGIDVEHIIDPANKFNCADLFPSIVQAAHEGDMTAWYVLSEAGRELADMALAVSQKLRLVRGTVCGAGSVFQHAALVRSSFRGALAANAAHLLYDEKVVDPVMGALEMARQTA